MNAAPLFTGPLSHHPHNFAFFLLWAANPADNAEGSAYVVSVFQGGMGMANGGSAGRLFPWREEYYVGIAFADAQHR